MMNLDLNIEKGGQSDNFGKGLEKSLSNLGENAVSNVVGGSKNVVESTGLEPDNWSTDEAKANNISAMVNLTGEEGLLNLSSNLEGYTMQLTEMGLNAPEKLVEVVLQEVEKVLAANGVMSAIKTGLDTTQKVVDLTKDGLDYATSYATIAGNAAKLIMLLNKMQDPDTMCNPNVKDSTNMLSASLMTQIVTTYYSLKAQLLIFYNSMICTSNDSTLDNVIVSVNAILNQIEPLIDPVLQEYTGYTISEVRNLCNQGFAYVGMIQRASAHTRENKEEIKDNINDKVDSKKQEIKDKILSEKEKLKLSKEELKEYKEKQVERAKQKFEEKKKDLSKEEAKAKLIEWIKEQNIVLQNAFHLLIIMDTIKSIKEFLKKMQNTSIENQVDLLNTLQDILHIFEDLGLTPDAEGLTIEDLKALGMAAAGTIAETGQNLGQQVQNNAESYMNEMGADIKQDQYMQASNVVDSLYGAGAEKLEDAKDPYESLYKSGAGKITESLNTANSSNNTENTEDSSVNLGQLNNNLSTNLSNNSSSLTSTVNKIQTMVTTKNTFADVCYYSISNQGKNINVEIELLKNFGWLFFIAFMGKFKDSSGKEIFNEGAKKRINDGLKEAWETNSTIEFTINAIVNKITKFYNFKITVNQEAYHNGGKVTKDTGRGTLTGKNIYTYDISTGTQNSSNGSITGNSDIINQTRYNISTDGVRGKVGNLGNAESQLTKGLQVNIDMSGIESILEGKVLMFDQVVQFLKILQPVIQLLYIICHLLENWKTNKEFVRTGQRVQLAEAMRNAAKLINGLKDIFTLGDTNFFVVRTKEMEKWIKSKDGFPDEKIDENGFMVINQIQTLKLNTYISTHGIKPDEPLILIKGTSLYFDRRGIEEGNQKDGTSRGLDIEINRELGEVYFDAQQRPSISSQILYARKRNIKPNYEIPIQVEEKKDIASLLKKVTFTSDEMEGTQTLNMCNVNLCPPLENRKEVKEAEKNAVIVEFGDEYTLGNRVEYSLTVKPGQTLSQGDILGYIKKGDKQLPIKTQFTGTIRSVDQINSDFYHVYPSTANRHIIIDNPVLCKSDDYNVNDVLDLQKNFKKAAELESLIVNCMPLSILPILLTKANRDENVLSTGTYGVYTLYDSYIQKYDTSIEDLGNQLKNACAKEGFVPTATSENSRNVNGKTYVKIDTGSTKRVVDNMTEIKNSIINKAISIYNNVNNLNSNDMISGDFAYGDCMGLAYDKDNTFHRGKDKVEFNNYYLSLLKAIPDSQKMASPVNIQLSDIQNQMDKMKLSDASIAAGFHIDMKNDFFDVNAIAEQVNNIGKDEEESYLDKYRRLINEIIDNRLTIEQKNRENIVIAFNEFYFKEINNKIENPYESLKQRLNITEGQEVNSQDLLNQIKMDKLGKIYDLNDTVDSSLFRARDKDEQEDDKKYFDVCKQAQTMFTYLISSNISTTTTPPPHQLTTSKLEKTEDINQVIDSINELGKNFIHQNITYKRNTYQTLYELTVAIVKQNYDSSIQSVIHQKQINEIQKIFPEMPKNTIDYIVNALNNIDKKENLDSTTIQFFNRMSNNVFYELVKSENDKIKEFWDDLLVEYRKCNSGSAIQAVKDYAEGMNSNITWPQSVKISIEQTNYDLYTFMDPFKEEKPEIKDIEFTDIDPTKLEDPKDVDTTVDLNNLPDIQQSSPITIFDYEYWLVYMLNATLFTLLPMYWADGFDIPPFMTPLLLPAIYLPVAPPVFIPKINVLMVFGIALRGMWPAPIILMVNLSSSDIDAMIFVKMILEIAKDMFEKAIDLVENGIPRMVNEMINGYINENDVAKKTIEKFRTYSSIIKAIPVKDKALIEQKMNDALYESVNENADLVNANKKLDETRTKLRMYDRRQILTREADLGNGPEPM